MNHDLVLFKYDACPFCYRVQSWLDGRGLKVALRDTRQDPSARQELLDLTGRTTVPCLVIDGEPMFESADIVAWLQANYGEPVPERADPPAPARPPADRTRRRSRILRRLKRR